MAWTTPNQQIYNTFTLLGARHGENYDVSEDCLCILEDILRKLSLEDPSLRTFRRAIGFGQNIRKDLIPLLIYIKHDPKTTKIVDTTIKILVNLSIPVECLLCIDSASRTDVGRHTIFELNRLLATSKEAFTDSRSTKAIIDHMKHTIENGSGLDPQQCEGIDNCLLLLRNILHIPENKTPSNYPNMQNEIIWNMFTQSIDKMIIYLMSHPQKMHWEVTLVQLIALMYKDQHVGTLQKLLNLWLEVSLSETSEDNESNTSPQCQGSGESSPVLTSDPTSDSSDNGGNECNKSEAQNVRSVQNRSKILLAGMKRGKSTETENSSGISSMNQSTESDEIPFLPQATSVDKEEDVDDKKRSSQSEVSDGGYVTQVENQESISTSSNDDDQEQPVHQKPHAFQKSRYNNQKNRATTALEKKELRRKKLVKRSKANIILMKGIMHHIPTDEDISNILKEFTVDFLLKGYGVLVYDLYTQLVTNAQLEMDTSHFFWLVTYFLKFATQLELDLEHINPVLSYEIISYLIFQGVWSCEELEISCKLPDADLKPCLRRLHLVVTAIKEFLQALGAYTKMLHVNEDDKQELLKLQRRISETEDIKCLFLLLLRHYNPNVQSKQYLQDLVVTNHIYLLFLENVPRKDKTSVMEHLKQFTSIEIMKQYGLLIENFKQNGEFVNNCVFTMMHHIAGDLGHVSMLFQPTILKAFSQIWETDYEICDDWADLIEFVIHRFISTPRAPISSQENNEKPLSTTAGSDQAKYVKSRVRVDRNVNRRAQRNQVFRAWYEFVCYSFYNSLSWTQEEKEKLQDFYNESRNSPNTITDITKRYENNGSKMKSQNSIIKELLEQSIINERQYNDFMKIKQPEGEQVRNNEASKKATLIPESLINGDIKVIREYLHRESKGKLILWLQKVIIETCFVKLGLGKADAIKRTKHVMEPSIYYYALMNLPVPLVPWTVAQQNILKYQPFVLLLHKLGFHLPVDTSKTFVRIPNFWTAEYTFGIAQQLGPIDSTNLKFDVNSIKARNDPRGPSMEPDSCLGQNQSLSFGNELSIDIPAPDDTTRCNLPPPELSIVKQGSDLSSDCSDTDTSLKQDCLHLTKSRKRNKISVESDLTRMYVSDEEYRDV